MSNITARFERANFLEGSQALAQLRVFMPTRLETNLGAITSARVGDVVEIVATLRDITGRALPLASLNFRDGDRILGSLAATSEGTAQFEWRPEIPGDRLFSVEFPASGFYLPSRDQVLVPVFMPTTLDFVNLPSEVDVGSPILLTLRLMDRLGAPVAAARVTLEQNGKLMDPKTTDASGMARFEFNPFEGGDYRLKGEFTGAQHVLSSVAEAAVKVFLSTNLSIVAPQPGQTATALSPLVLSHVWNQRDRGGAVWFGRHGC